MKRFPSSILLCLVLLVASCVLMAPGASAADPMSDFDYARYGSDYPDVLRACGPYIYYDDLYRHYLLYGAGEGRTAYSLRTNQPFELEADAAQTYQTQLKLTGAAARLGSAVLSPDRSWPAPLLAAADQILAQVGGSTPYETLRGCYDWLIQNCSYGGKTIVIGDGGITASLAYSMLVDHVGVCDDYSSAFLVLARMIGFDARLQSGLTHRAAGGYTGHTWCVINIHGVDYVFDPQVEDNIAAGGTIRYLRFCKTYEEVPDKYVRYADDIVQSSIMNGEDPTGTYAFGQAGSYFAQVNEARAAAGVSPLTWDADLARAALRIAKGEEADTVLADLQMQTGKQALYSIDSIFYPSPTSSDNLSRSYKSAGVGFFGSSMCILYSRS